MIGAFLGMMSGEGEDAASAGFMAQAVPEANAYEFQSGGVIDLLKRLRDEFRSKKAESDKEELNSALASAMIVQDLADSIENAQKDIEQKTALKASKEENAARDKKTLAATTACKEADEKSLSDMVAECHEKGLSFEEKQELRADEIAALEKAVEILSSASVSG